MELGLRGKRVVVTGASRGIGLAIVRGFVAEGATVVAGARRVTPELEKLEGVTAVAVDLAGADGPARLVAAAGDRIDVLVNNVGIAPPRPQGFLEVTDDMWAATWNLNVMSAVRATRAALPHLLAAGDGRIVTVSSINARLPDPLVIDYSAAKAALSNFCKALSKEVGPRGVRINTVSPGPVATALWQGDGGVAATVGQSRGVDPGEVARDAAAQAATGRFTLPSEVADLVLFLASRRSGNITGADFAVDGGLIDAL